MKSINTITGYVGTFLGELILPQSNLHEMQILACKEFSKLKSTVSAPSQETQNEVSSWKKIIDRLEEFDQILPYLNSDDFAVREYATNALANLPLSEIVTNKFKDYWNSDNSEVRYRVRCAYGLYRFHNLPPVLKDSELAGLLDLTPEMMEDIYNNIAKFIKSDSFNKAELEIAKDLQFILEKVKRLELIQDRFKELRELGLSNHWYGRQLSHSYLSATMNGLTEDIIKLDREFFLYRKLLNENLKLSQPFEPGYLIDLVINAKNLSEGLTGQLRFSDEAEKIISVVRKHRAKDIIFFIKALENEDATSILELAPKLSEYNQQVIRRILGSPSISVDWEVGKETILKLVTALNEEQMINIDFYSRVMQASQKYMSDSTNHKSINFDTVKELFRFYHSMAKLETTVRDNHANELEMVINETLVFGSFFEEFRVEPIRKLRDEYENLLANNENEKACSVLLKVRAYFLSESKLLEHKIPRESESAILFQQAVAKASLEAGEPTLGKELQETLGKVWINSNKPKK
jgi:hypothetical protein